MNAFSLAILGTLCIIESDPVTTALIGYWLYLRYAIFTHAVK